MSNQQPPDAAMAQLKSQLIAGAISLFDAQEKAYQQIIQEAAKEIERLKAENAQLKKKPTAKKSK